MIALCFPGILFLIALGPISNILYYDRKFSLMKYDPWKNYTDDSGPWCERHYDYGLVKEKSNAYSEYVFLLSGIYLLARAKYGRKERETENLLKLMPNLVYFYAIINIFYAVGSFINHSCRCSFGHQLDLIGMYSITNFWIPYYTLRYSYYKRNNVYISYNKKNIITKLYKRYCFIFFGLSIIVFPFTSVPYSHPYSEASEFFILFISSCLCLFLDLITHRLCKKKQITLYYLAKGKCLYMGIAVILFGITMKKIDELGILCDPMHFIQFHSIWHVTVAIITIMAYEHANSEFPYYMNLPYVNTFPTVKSP